MPSIKKIVRSAACIQLHEDLSDTALHTHHGRWCDRSTLGSVGSNGNARRSQARRRKSSIGWSRVIIPRMAHWNTDGGAGSSATRNKIAKHFANAGIAVSRSLDRNPPTDDDFLDAVFQHFGQDLLVVVFKRGNDLLHVPISQSTLDWLQPDPQRRYLLFEAEIVSGGYAGKLASYFLFRDKDDPENFILQKIMTRGSSMETLEFEIRPKPR